jgi:uncharacterized membrane protein YgaE (UPF0421/DUF939 family)
MGKRHWRGGRPWRKIRITPLVGMRTLKTALVVFICLALYQLMERFGYTSRFDAFMACTAAIICMQETMEKSMSSGLNRFLGTAVGAAVGMLFLYLDAFFNNQYMVMAMISLGIIILIFICNVANINNAIVIGCVVFLVIALEQTSEAPFTHSVRRLMDTMIGIALAIGVNQFIRNPDVHNKSGADGGGDGDGDGDPGGAGREEK